MISFPSTVRMRSAAVDAELLFNIITLTEELFVSLITFEAEDLNDVSVNPDIVEVDVAVLIMIDDTPVTASEAVLPAGNVIEEDPTCKS